MIHMSRYQSGYGVVQGPATAGRLSTLRARLGMVAGVGGIPGILTIAWWSCLACCSGEIYGFEHITYG